MSNGMGFGQRYPFYDHAHKPMGMNSGQPGQMAPPPVHQGQQRPQQPSNGGLF
jgi:hypothetical protein